MQNSDNSSPAVLPESSTGLVGQYESDVSVLAVHGKTVILVYGTKVNDELLAEALRAEEARKAAERAAAGIPENVLTKDEAQLMINQAVSQALAAQKQPPAK